MSRNLLVCVVLLLVLAVSFSAAQVKTALGVKGGLNMGTVSFDPTLPAEVKQSSRTSFAAGGSFVMMFSGPIGLELDALYLNGGTVLEFDVPTGGGTVHAKQTQKVTYLHIPLLLMGKFDTKSIVHPYVYAGPALGILMTAKTLTEATGYDSEETDVKSEINSTDFSIVFGGGAEFMVAKKVGITVDGRYSLGMSDLSKEADSKVKSRNIMIMAGVLFHL